MPVAIIVVVVAAQVYTDRGLSNQRNFFYWLLKYLFVYVEKCCQGRKKIVEQNGSGFVPPFRLRLPHLQGQGEAWMRMKTKRGDSKRKMVSL